jgi:hypothetical protein
MVNSASGSKFLAYELQLHSTYGSVGSVSGVSGTPYTKIKNSICEYGIGDGKDDYCINDGYIISSGGTETSSICNFNTTSDDLLMTRLCCAQYGTLYVLGIGIGSGITAYTSLDFVEEI